MLARNTLVLSVIILLVGVSTQARETIGSQELGEEVDFPSGQLSLGGSLFLPAAGGPFAAVVAITGSGEYSYRSSWDEDGFGMWRAVTETLVEQGFAVLLVDKRGINRSGGAWNRNDLYGRAEDVLAAVRYLQARPEIDGNRIGLIGHSQGGWVGQIAAASAPNNVAFLITLCGATVSVQEQILEDYETEWRCAGIPEARIERKRAWSRFTLGAYGLLSRVLRIGFLGQIINFDPAETLRQITQPVMALFGENDGLVYADRNRDLLLAAFADSGHTQHVIDILVGAAHGLQLAERCHPSVRPITFSPELFESLRDPLFWEMVETHVSELPP